MINKQKDLVWKFKEEIKKSRQEVELWNSNKSYEIKVKKLKMKERTEARRLAASIWVVDDR